MTGIVVCNHVEHFFLSISHHLLTCGVAVCPTGTCEEQSQIVVNLCGGAHGGPRVLVGGLLFYADDGRQTGYLVYVWSFHASEEISCVCREGFYIAALSFCEDGVEGQT